MGGSRAWGLLCERGIDVHPRLDTAGAGLLWLLSPPAFPALLHGWSLPHPPHLSRAVLASRNGFFCSNPAPQTWSRVSWGLGCDLRLLFRFHSIFQLATSGRENQTLLCPGSCVHLLPHSVPCVKGSPSIRPGDQGTGDVCGWLLPKSRDFWQLQPPALPPCTDPAPAAGVGAPNSIPNISLCSCRNYLEPESWFWCKGRRSSTWLRSATGHCQLKCVPRRSSSLEGSTGTT